MTCQHPNLLIRESLIGTAVHIWRDGEYDWSEERIEVQSISLDCPDCSYQETYLRGEDIPEEIFAKIQEARSFSHGGPLQ